MGDRWVTALVYAGMVLVLLGPALGTYLPIRNARTPAARRFLVRLAAVTWAVFLVFCILPIMLAYHGVLPPQAYSSGFLAFLIFPAIPWINRRVKELEAETPTAAK